MRARGALHVHSDLSHDGRMTIAELAEWYRPRGFHFVAMGEHSQDMDEARVRALLAECAVHSTPEFLMLPGIEFTCEPSDMHILGVGVAALTPHTEPVAVVRHIHEHGGVAVLAHPKRVGWNCSRELLLALDAAEIWNVGYDGRYLPAAQAPGEFRRLREANPRLLAVASHDLHRREGYYNVAVEMEVTALSREAVLGNLREGTYRIRSRFFSTGSGGRISWTQAAWLQLFSPQLSFLRNARSLVLRGLA